MMEWFAPESLGTKGGVMAIVADIQDLAAAEFLLMLSMNQKSGKLVAVNGDEKAMVAFRNGSIVYAASTAIRERVGSILLSLGLVTEIDLQHAIDIQKAAPGVKHLGNILVELGVITPEALADVVRSQFQKVVMELLSWQEGVLTFNRMDIPNLGAVHVNPREIMVDVGFETEQLVIGSMSELEDEQRDLAVQAQAARTRLEAPFAEEEAGDDEVSPEAHQLVRSMMQEMQNLSISITAEISLEVLTTALEVVRRSMLLLVYPNHIGGVGGFGFQRDDQSSEEVVRNFVVSRDQESVFTKVMVTGHTYHGSLGDTTYDQHIIEQLGGIRPHEVVVVPLIFSGEVAALLYGDNALDGLPITEVDHLEQLMSDIGTRMEQNHAESA